MDGWNNQQTEGWIDGQMDGSMKLQTNVQMDR